MAHEETTSRHRGGMKKRFMLSKDFFYFNFPLAIMSEMTYY
jgi:hypothetical protein